MEAKETTFSSDPAPAATTREASAKRYTTISIPQPLYEDIKKAILGTGFRSPTEFLVYVTRLSLQSNLVKDEMRNRGPPFFNPR